MLDVSWTQVGAEDVESAREKLDRTAQIGKELVRETDWPAFLSDWRVKLLVALAAALVLIGVVRRIQRVLRRRKPPTFHPLLQKYSGAPDPKLRELAAERGRLAEHIIATSSSAAIAGYELTEQIEAVYVDGFQRPEEALEGLKAAAAMKGANAVINVHHEHGADGRCSAFGDAVVVARLEARMTHDAGAEPLDDDGTDYVADPMTPSTGDDADA